MRGWGIFAFALLIACSGTTRVPASTPAPPAPASVTPVDPPRPTAEQVLQRLCTTDAPPPDWFTPSFLSAVPLAKIEETGRQLRATSGAFKGVRAEGDHWLLDFERATWRANLSLDPAGRVAGLTVRPSDVKATTLEDALAEFRTFPGKVSVVVATDGAERGAIEPDAPLAVGSTFKLATLTALRREIEQKKRAWTDVIGLRPEVRSLPSGILQQWPEGSPLTLYSLAALMISRSDNTATDALIALLGRDAIEPFASRNRPYLTTRELFVLKMPANADLRARFEHGDEAGRRAVLRETQGRPLPNAEAYPKDPTALDVEWFFTTRELCDLMKGVHDLPLMSIDPGLAERGDWSAIAYKGGSEPGVLNMTTWVERGGHASCVSATWNAPQELEELRFATAYRRVLSWLKGN